MYKEAPITSLSTITETATMAQSAARKSHNQCREFDLHL